MLTFQQFNSWSSFEWITWELRGLTYSSHYRKIQRVWPAFEYNIFNKFIALIKVLVCQYPVRISQLLNNNSCEDSCDKRWMKQNCLFVYVLNAILLLCTTQCVGDDNGDSVHCLLGSLRHLVNDWSTWL